MHRLLLSAPLLLVLVQDVEPEAEPEPCLPCAAANDPNVAAVQDGLQEAFGLSMTVPDCSGAQGLETCRRIEALLEQSFETLDALVADGESGAIECVACDPRPHLSPLYSSFETVAELLIERGYDEFSGKRMRMEQEITLWKGYTCCAADKKGSRARTRNREMDARAALAEKCGANFEKNRSGLRQVVRMPGDRDGCFQSRACRDATQREGQLLEAGFWTYDGEYWYIWAERRTPRGDWVECNP